MGAAVEAPNALTGEVTGLVGINGAVGFIVQVGRQWVLLLRLYVIETFKYEKEESENLRGQRSKMNLHISDCNSFLSSFKLHNITIIVTVGLNSRCFQVLCSSCVVLLQKYNKCLQMELCEDKH